MRNRPTWRVAVHVVALSSASAAAADEVTDTLVINRTGRDIAVTFSATGCSWSGSPPGTCLAQTMTRGSSVALSWTGARAGTDRRVRVECGGEVSWFDATPYLVVGNGRDCGQSYFKLVHPSTNLCVDVAYYDAARGRAVGLYECEDHLDQSFFLDNDGHIRSARSGLVIDVSEADGAAGRVVQMWDLDSHPDQSWTLPAGSVGPIVNGAARKCLQARSGAQATLADCNGGADQKFIVVRHPG